MLLTRAELLILHFRPDIQTYSTEQKVFRTMAANYGEMAYIHVMGYQLQGMNIHYE